MAFINGARVREKMDKCIVSLHFSHSLHSQTYLSFIQIEIIQCEWKLQIWQHPKCFNYISRHILRSYESTFSKITPANRDRLAGSFTGRCRLRWHASLFPTNFWCPLLNGRKRRRKMHFANFLSPKQCTVSPTFRRPISVKFEHKT